MKLEFDDAADEYAQKEPARVDINIGVDLKED